MLPLWNDLWGTDTFKTAQTLRYEILSPLVALDLIQQSERAGRIIDNDALKSLRVDIQKAIAKLNDPINDFCSIPAIVCDDFKETLQKLRICDAYSTSDEFHRDLERVADQMEAQIEAIGG